MLSYFRWWRWLRGGRWARVTGWLWGKRWVQIPQECVEPHDEHHRKRFCGLCRYAHLGEKSTCWHPRELSHVDNYWGRQSFSVTRCEVKNRHMDCRDYKVPQMGTK